jgi:hypothetical protein
MSEPKNVTIELTPEEVKMLQEIFNTVNFPGAVIEKVFKLRSKIFSV